MHRCIETRGCYVVFPRLLLLLLLFFSLSDFRLILFWLEFLLFFFLFCENETEIEKQSTELARFYFADIEFCFVCAQRYALVYININVFVCVLLFVFALPFL